VFFVAAGSFLAMISLEFPVERFLVTCGRETLINEWDSHWTERSEGVHFLGWEGQEEEREEIWDNYRRILVGCGILSFEWIVRGTLFLWIPSPSSRVNCH
jgi:hypothetical protein